MRGKILINVYTLGVKNDLLNIMIRNKREFLEVQSNYEFDLKYNLIKEEMDLYIHELDESNYEESMKLIKGIDRDNIRCILLIHKYSSEIIDDALALKVSDIVVLPINRENLEKKLLASTVVRNANSFMPAAPVDAIEVKVDQSRIVDEMNRAVRGNYPLSLVLIEYQDMGIELYKIFKRDLRKLLRNTDQVLRYEENELLILCPFTPKSYLVEVENKVRTAHKMLKKVAVNQVIMNLYGVTFPVDGDSAEGLMKLLKDGIHDSKLVAGLDSTVSKVDRDNIRRRLRRKYH